MRPALALVVAACTREAIEHPPEGERWLSPEAARDARTATAELRNLEQPIVARGRIVFHDQHVTRVFSPVTGRVTDVHVRPGDRVEPGDPLVTMISSDVGAAQAELVSTRAALAATDADLRRETSLLAHDATSVRAREAAEDARRTADAAFRRAHLQVQALEASTGRAYVVRSRVGGEVTERAVDPGAAVIGQYSGGPAPVLVTIGDTAEVWAEGDVADLELPHVAVGDAVDVDVAGERRTARIDYIASTADPVLRTRRIRCGLANPTRLLKPGMIATLRVRRPATYGLVVPREAVVRTSEANFVYVAAGVRPDGRHVFVRHHVTSGDERDGVISIRDGLDAGDVVLVGTRPAAETRARVRLTADAFAASRVTTAVAEQRPTSGSRTIGGRVVFDASRISAVASQVNGRITEVLAAPGQRIVRGTPLAVLTSPDVGKNLADRLAAQARMIQTSRELRRQRELYAEHVTAQRDLQAAEAEAAKACAEDERTRRLVEQLELAPGDLVSQRYVLRSPIDGQVIARTAKPGLEVQGQYSNQGNTSETTPLFTIGALDPIWVIGEAHEADLPYLHEGAGAAIRVAGDPAVHAARVEWISEVLTATTGTAQVRCIVANPDHRLVPDASATLDVEVPGSPAVVVPRNAVLRSAHDTIVFVVHRAHDGVVELERRPVHADVDETKREVAVRAGLAAGETVVVDHAVIMLGLVGR
ncbi:MAG: efflux RND transporter periplasmic adaptor subunit [Deltaproteobacteria bacterium]|nr:efflux RND transporter periplasmic adaptor subunit [Deltaproteobacteria bacterium]